MTGSVVPPDRGSFEREVLCYCREVLTPNPASDYLIEFIKSALDPEHAACRRNIRLILGCDRWPMRCSHSVPVRTVPCCSMRLVTSAACPPTSATDSAFRGVAGTIGDIEPSVPPSGRGGPTSLRRSGGIRSPARAGFANRDARPHGSEVSAQFTLGAENSMKKLLRTMSILGVAVRRVKRARWTGPFTTRQKETEQWRATC